jgi:outer membrane receptor for ferrienterochelin and colicin
MNSRQKLFICLIIAAFPHIPAITQVTTGSIGGYVKTVAGERMSGAVIRIIHEPTGTAFFSLTNRSGLYAVENLNPGGPYIVQASFLNFNTAVQNDIVIHLGEKFQADLTMEPVSVQLQQVTVLGIRRNISRQAQTMIVDGDKIEALPSAARSLQDYLVSLPQSKTVPGNEGAVSFAGQNNRYNAFYIDGAINNDVFGLAASGTNGGQAGISALSVDAIEQLQVTLSPYDASLGNFTGAGINAVTRSGTNKRQVSFYHYFSNRQLQGKIPLHTGTDHFIEPDFYRRIYGMRMQGPVVKNRLFFFINIELQREEQAQPFVFEEYQGQTRDPKLLAILADNLRSQYGYDAGSFTSSPGLVFADRIVTRFDWNLHTRHSLSLSGRSMNGQRVASNNSDAGTIHFSNGGYSLLTRNWSASLEWKSRIGRNASNRLLLTYTNVKDDRGPSGQPFPNVRVYDGIGSVVFGTDISSTVNLLTQQNWILSDKWNINTGRHTLGWGVDAAYHRIYNAFIQNAFGSYSYGSLAEFISNRSPFAYRLGFSVIDSIQGDHINAAAKISMLRTAFFMNDEYRVNNRLALQLGLRLDMHFFLNQPVGSDHLNDTALPVFAKYYDLQGAGSGNPVEVPATISPRLGFSYKLPSGDALLRGGVGMFTGRMPLAWPGGVYQYNGSFIGGFQPSGTQLNRVLFRPDPYRQWKPDDLGMIMNKEPVNLVTEKIYMPALLRISVSIDKNFRKDWDATAAFLFSKNIREIAYTNINLAPPVQKLAGPDTRNIYTDTNQARIPLRADGSNPYDYVILIGNHTSNTGYAFDLSVSLRKRIEDKWKFEVNYSYDVSTVLQDGTSSVNLSQWRTIESINGRNSIQRSVSDFSGGHRVFAWVCRKFIYAHRKLTTTVSVTYNGQSGSPISYVYGGSSIVRDDGKTGGYELLYVPTEKELNLMHFESFILHNILFTEVQQRQALEEYISADKYLAKRRGLYAERNGSRTPFTHIVDCKLIQDILLRINKVNYKFQLSIDILNIGNLLNPGWGHRYVLPFDKIEPIEFAGLGPGLQPGYRFNPFLLPAAKFPASRSGTPAYASFWSCQLGFRFTF